MAEVFSTRPRHSEHEMHGYTKGLSTVDMRKARRVRDDSLSNEVLSGDGIRLDARHPAPGEHFCYHSALLLDVAVAETLHAREETWVLDHVCHQVGRITADRKEFETGFTYEVAEAIVGSEPDAVAVLEELAPQGDKRLHIPPTSNNLYDDV